MNEAILAKTRFSMPAAKVVIFIFMLIVVVTFSVENIDLVPVTYYDFYFQKQTLQVPLLILIFCSLLSGFLLAWLGGVLKQVRLRSELRKTKRAVRSLTSQIEKIKSEA